MVNMKKRGFSQGFTLIELLVVIAIIGLLAAVVLASVGTARNKGGDAAVKSNMANIRTQAELFASNNGNVYTGMCADTTVAAALTAAGGVTTTTAVCNAAASVWAAAAQMVTTNLVTTASGTDYWCVDSTGASRLRDAALGAATAC